MTIRKLSHIFYLVTGLLILLLTLFVTLRFNEQRKLIHAQNAVCLFPWLRTGCGNPPITSHV